MKSTDATPPYETLEIATPLDYTTDLYRFYFEVGEHNGIAKKIISNFLGEERSKQIVTLEHGYEIDLPIQCVPDIAKELVNDGIAIYQIARYAKTNGVWGT